MGDTKMSPSEVTLQEEGRWEEEKGRRSSS